MRSARSRRPMNRAGRSQSHPSGRMGYGLRAHIRGGIDGAARVPGGLGTVGVRHVCGDRVGPGVYQSGFAPGTGAVASFGAAAPLPRVGWTWLAARVVLDVAGSLFGVYLLISLGLAAAALVMRSRQWADADADADEGVLVRSGVWPG